MRPIYIKIRSTTSLARGGDQRRTDVIGVELVNSNESANSKGSESPARKGAQDREFALVKIIDEGRIKLFCAISQVHSMEQKI